ncbi:NAD-dependent epimerase/dehydratase family protein, partial [Brucella melitensis]
MRILVTGGAGYIGSHTLLAVLAAGHEAHVIDNFSNSHPEALAR